MAYDFRNLSYLDFEELARDLIGRELGLRFEAFCAGPDGGIDGRNAKPKSGTVILQAKHYAGSALSDLKAAINRARPGIDKLHPGRYVLATSCRLTPANKAQLAALIGPSLANESDIFGPEDLNALLRKFGDVEQANIKLWLSSAAVLERVLNAARHAVTAISREEIEAKVRVYAPNPSFQEAKNKLESRHIVIISGPPGVGKTTLAEMLSFAYTAEGWEYIAVRSLDDGFAKLHNDQKQIFFFDDFLGTAALDVRALAAKDSDLARFIKRVRSSKNARFVLTTRAPIFEEARRVSERLADKSLDVAKYVLDVGIYTRRIRARILYNHLLVSGISLEHIQALWATGTVAEIIDHKNYNPRVVEAMTDGVQIQHVEAKDYPSEFIQALNNPKRIWDVSFRTYIPVKCRDLLYCLFFSSDYGVAVDELNVAFNALHQFVSSKYAIPHDPSDFEEALRILEGGYIDISNRGISFINPSLRDYLADYINDVAQVCDFAAAAQKADWAERVWDHVCLTKEWSTERQALVARSFLPIAERFHALPETKRTSNGWSYYDLPYPERIALLLSWYAISKDDRLAELAAQVAAQRTTHYDEGRDGCQLVKLLVDIHNGDCGELHNGQTLADLMEDSLVDLLSWNVLPDDLESIYQEIDKNKDLLGPRILEALNQAMIDQIEQAGSIAEGYGDESDVEDQIKSIHRFAERLGIAKSKLARAVSAVEDQIAKIQEGEAEPASRPAYSSVPTPEPDKFSDADLANLFAPLVSGYK
ncbi:restriction endonuclease [Bradyrhizobium sp. Pa8]|uniref:nSTAND3 domain-containing NTPase n=1 Tax=Bradyrhizobium sp. Pa8 TaxID=3386552 RepID=UPI00403FA1BA